MFLLFQRVADDISSHSESIEHLKSVSNKLIKIINIDESELLRQKISSIIDKYAEIKQSCDNIGSLLKEAQKGIGKFSTAYVTIITWIEETTIQLTSYQILSIYSDKLQVQIKDLKVCILQPMLP